MDSRHWWFVNRVQETFQFGTNDSPVLYEQFLADASNIREMNKFLSAQGCRLLIFYDTFFSDTSTSRDLSVVTELIPGAEIYQESNLAVVFFRPEVLTEELDLTSLQQDVMCLELKLTDLTAMLGLISQLYLPMVEQEALTLRNIPQIEIDNYKKSLNEHLQTLTCLVEKSEPHLNILSAHTKQVRDANWTNSPMAFELSTTMLQDWLSTIHSHLTDVIDVPSMEMETQSSPLEELRKWSARQRIFTSILKQMRGEDVRSIIKLLSPSKPDLVHMWTDTEAQVIQINSVAKNKLVFLNSINKHFSTMVLHSSSLEALNVSLSTINSSTGLFVGFQLPSQRGYLGYVYYKLVCEIIRLTSAFLLNGKSTMLADHASSPWFYLNTNKLAENYRNFLKLLNEVLNLERNLTQHISILKEKGLLKNLSTLSGKKESAITENQDVYKEFSNIETLLSPLRTFSGHVESLLKLENDNLKLVEFCDKLIVYPSCPEVTWKDNPLTLCSVEIVVSSIPEQDNEFIQESPTSSSSRKKRPIGSGKMGILLEVDEDKSFDTPSLSRRDSDSEGYSDSSDIEPKRYIQREYTRFSEQIKGWLEDNLDFACKRYPTGPAFLYEPTSSNYESFDKLLGSLLSSLEILNRNIEMTFTELTNSQFCMNEQLALVDIFNGWAVDLKATEFSKFYLTKAFNQFEENTLSLEQRFLEDKITPSKLLDISRVTESVRWSRLILGKLEQPMQRLSKYELVLKNPEYVEIFNKYKTFNADLKQYEKIWIKFCQEAVKEIAKQKQNKLLLVPQESELIKVNLNPIIFIAIRELKSLIKVGVKLPLKSEELLFSEERLKLNFDRANFVKSEFLKFHFSIPEYLIPLYEPRLKLFLKSLQPGWTHLTWRNINLDIFFETANRELSKLNASVKDVIVFISSAKDNFQSSVNNLPTILRDLLTSENSISIEQFQNLFSNFISKTQSKIENILLTFQSVICQSYLKINQSDEEYEKYSPKELLEIVSKKLESDPHSSSMKSFLQFYISWSHETILTWTMDQFKQYLNLINFTLCKGNKQDFLDKQLSKLHSESTLSLANLHTFVTSSDFNEIVNSFTKHRLRILCEVIFEVPFVLSVPSYETISDTILACFDQLVSVFSFLFNSSCMFESTMNNEKLLAEAKSIRTAIKSNLIELVNPLRYIFNFFSNFDSIRRGELFQTYEQIRTHSEYLNLSTNIVHSLFDILIFLRNLVPAFNLGILKMSLAPLQMSLALLIQMWKDKFSSYLLDNFESQLKDFIMKRETIHSHLDKKVENIIDLDVVLKYLRDVFNLEFTIESTFSQIEASYQLLDSYEVTIQRAFLEEVNNLRKNWQIVIERARELQEHFITQNYLKYERDIEREMKTFEIKTIQLLKEFEAEGPCVIGIDAETAKSRLNTFSDKYAQFLSKKELLSSLQTTYFIPTSNYSDLDKVGKEISILKKLYLLYENLCAFEKDTKSQPWIILQFDICQKQMTQFNEEFEELDRSLFEWDAYRYIQRTINMYFEVLPILRKLQDTTFKPRHWLMLMSLGSKHFAINSQKLTLENVLKLNLVQHSLEIDEICKKAIAEAEVDKVLKNISNELQDQVFVFIDSQDQVPQVSTESAVNVLEVLEDHYVTLSSVLTSRYISHFLIEATQLSSHIKTIQTFINHLTYSQTLAFQLDSIFKNSQTDFPPTAAFNEAQINFVAAFKRWKKLMKKIEEPSNIFVCCCNDDQIGDQLECIIKELENCRFSIEEYLESIRASYPFLYFLSDHDLLDLLKHQSNPTAMVPHIKPFFPQLIQFTYDEKPRRRSVVQIETEKQIKQINGFISSIGEEVCLHRSVPVCGESYNTISELMKETRRTLQVEFSDFVKECRDKKMPNVEYDVFMFNWERLTTQVALISLHSIWTKNLQEAIINFRSHKNALSEATTLFFQHISRLLALVNTSHPSRNPIYFRNKLECLVFYGLWLRDIGYDLAEKKPRDISDFEWQRYLRMYFHSTPGLAESNYEMVDYNETLNLTLRCLFTTIPYGFDYIGYATPNIFLTSSMKTIHLIYLSILEHRHTQFKTNLPLEFMHSAKEFSRIHGRHFMQLRIHESFSPKAMSCFLLGTFLSKYWGLVNGWNHISKECLSIFTSVVSRLHERNFPSDTNESIRNESSILMLVTNIDHFLVCNLRPLFKSCSYLPPNDYYILKLYCLARGIRASKQLIDKMLWFKDILPILYPEASHVRFTIPFFISILNHVSAEKSKSIASRRSSMVGSDSGFETDIRFRSRRSSQSHSRALKQLQSHRFTFGNILNITPDKPPSPSLPNKEQGMIASFLVDTCVPRFQPEMHLKFLSLVDTVFGTSYFSTPTDSFVIPNFYFIFTKRCSEMEIIPTSFLEEQVKAIHRAANTYHGFILFGKPGTGKSTAFKVYISCLKNFTGDITNDNILMYNRHRTYHIYPKSLYSQLSLIGKVDDRQCWRDGILSQAVRYANTDSKCLVWIVIDDIIQSPLFEFLSSSIFSSSLTLSNGQCLPIPNNVRFILETINLSSLSLSFLNLFQMIYFSSDAVEFDSFAMLSIRKHPKHLKNIIHRALQKIMGVFIRDHLSQYQPINEFNMSSLYKTFFTYFDQLIVNYLNCPENPEPVNLSLIERFALFALISSFGIHLEEYRWASFTRDLYSLSDCLPDLDSGLTIFDYCMSNLGDWDTIHMVYSDSYPAYNVTCNGDLIVKCTNLYRVNMLAELCVSSERPIMIIGPHSSGKSSLIKNLIYTRSYDDITQDVLHQAIDPSTTVASLYDSLYSRLECRYLDTYGPPKNHKLNFFIDDLHIGQSTDNANSPVQEFIRCLIEGKGCFSDEFPTQWLTLEDVYMICAMTSDRYLPWTHTRMAQHFNVIRLYPEAITQDTVYHMLDALTQPEGVSKYSPEVLNTLTKTSQTIYRLVSTIFQTADILGRNHYYFSWKDISLIFHGFRVCADELLEGESEVFNLLYHITNRVYSAQLCNLSDLNTFKCIMEKQWNHDKSNESYIENEFKDIPYFTTLVEEHKPDTSNALYQSLSHAMEINTNIILHPTKQLDQLVKYVTKLQNQHNDKYVERPCISMLTLSDIKQLDYLNFLLSFPKSSILFVGRHMMKLSDISRLAYFAAGFEYLELILKTKQSFIDGIKSAIRQAALGSKSVGFVITSDQLQLDYVRDLFNTYLVTGHVDHVFAFDEFNSLVSSIEPTYKRLYANTYTDARQYFSVQIQKNLKVIICIETHNPLLNNFELFPGLVKGCYVSIYKDWCGHNIMGDMIELVKRPESKIPITSLPSTFSMDSIITLLLTMHGAFIKQDRDLNFMERISSYPKNAFGELDPFSERDTRKLSSSSSLFQHFFEDNVQFFQDYEKVRKGGVSLVGGFSFQRFIKVFFTIYISESKNNERKSKSLLRCLSAHEELQRRHEKLVQEVACIEGEIVEKDAECESLLEKLSQISCKIESIKVFSSDSDSSILRATLATIRAQDETLMDLLEFEEDKQLIINLLENETQLKQSSNDEQTKRHNKQIEVLQAKVDNNMKLVNVAENEVKLTFNKISRVTLENVKSLHNPPKQVIPVLETLVFLLKRQQRALSSVPSFKFDASYCVENNSDASSCLDPNLFLSPHPRLTRQHTTRPGPQPIAPRGSAEAWNSIQQAIGQDAQKFLDSLANITWKFGLDHEVTQFIERNFASSRNTAQHKVGTGLITVQSAKHAAEGAGIICAYVIALAEYNYIYRQHRVLEEEIYQLKSEIIAINEERVTPQIDLPTLTYEKHFIDEQQVAEYDLDNLEKELIEVEAEFHRAVYQQHQLKEKFVKQNSLTQSLLEILESTEVLKSSWQQSFESLYDNQSLMYYCIATALLISYLGPTPPYLRKIFFDDAFHKMSACFDDSKCQTSFSYANLKDFLIQLVNRNLDMTDIPDDNFVQENLTLIFNRYLPNFPLIIDPYGIFLFWIKDQTPYYCISYYANNLTQILDDYSTQAKKLVIYDVELEHLSTNQSLLKILIAKTVKHSFTMKPNFAQKDIIHASFQLFLISPIKQEIPYSLLAVVTPVLFSATREGFAKDLGRVCLSVLEPSKYSEMRENEAKLFSSLKAITALENELSNAICISFQIDNLATKCKTITSCSSNYQANKEIYQNSIAFQKNSLLKNTLVFDGGEVAAIVFDVLRCMSVLNDNYQTSYSNFKQFLKGIYEGYERIDPRLIPDIILRFCYSFMNQSFSENDRVHFALMLAIEYEIFRKKARRSDAEMLFSALYPIKHNTKKPFDWMQEKQWDNLNAMGQSVKKIQEAVDRMAREGRATQWRTFCENESPDEPDFPDGLNTTLSHLEKLLILKCVKQDNLKNSITRFIDKSLGVDLIKGSQMDYNMVISKLTSPQTPILILSTHPLSTILVLNNITKYCKSTMEIISLYGDSPDDISQVFQVITSSSIRGNWVFIQNVDLNPRLMKLLPFYLDSLTSCHESFRVWFGCTPTSPLDPVFVKRCIRLHMGVPFEPKNSAISCLELLRLDDNMLAITRTEWTPILHSLIMIHVACRYRVVLSPSSFEQQYRWSIDSLIRSLRLVLLEIEQCANTMLTYSQQNKPFSWPCVRYMIGELTYGSGLVFTQDTELLNGMLDYWLNSNSIKPNYEFPRSQHRLPNAFFKNNPKPKELIHGFLTETSLIQLRSPEICGLYSKSQFFSPDEIVNNTKKLNDTLKIYRLEDQPIIITQTIKDSISQKVAKFRGSKKRSSSIFEITKRFATEKTMERSPSLCTSTVSMSTIQHPFPIRGQFKDLLVHEKCSSLLSELPHLENINNYTIKCEQFSNQYLQSFFIQELSTWANCIGEIRGDLQTIQNNLLFSKQIGVSPAFLRHIRDLNDNSVPSKWQKLIGPSAPPDCQTFSTWFDNLKKRYQYLFEIIDNGNLSCYNLGYFFYPGQLLASFCLLKSKTDSLNFEKSCLIGEITTKEKEHVKDPPPVGIYASEISINGCVWDKNSGEINDIPTSKSVNTVLPLVHITRAQAGQLSNRKDGIRGPHLYYCPVYRNEKKKDVFFHIKIQNNDIPRIRWMMRGLTCTLQHY